MQEKEILHGFSPVLLIAVSSLIVQLLTLQRWPTFLKKLLIVEIISFISTLLIYLIVFFDIIYIFVSKFYGD